MQETKCHVVIEDIRPYSGKLSMQTINTCKFIGELTYRLRNELQASYSLVSRSEVRQWVFLTHTELCVGRINQKIAYLDDYGERTNRKRYRNKNGELRKASFHYVDDRVIIAAMKKHWEIPTPKPGKPNVYGFASHSWQALAAGSHYLATSSENQQGLH